MITAEGVVVAVRECTVACPQSATGTIVCRCLQITQEEIHEAADSGLFNGGVAISVREITRQTGAGAGCTACHKRIRDLLAARQRQQVAIEAA